MNYCPALSAVMCHSCGGEFYPEQLNEDAHCLGCRVDAQLAREAEEAELVVVARVVEQARARASRLEPTTYSVRPSLAKIISESMNKARELISGRVGVAS